MAWCLGHILLPLWGTTRQTSDDSSQFPYLRFQSLPLTPSDGESPLSMGYGESSSPQLLLLLDSFMHRQTQTNGSGVCNIFQQKDPFFSNLTLLIPFSHMPVLMNEA